MRLLVVRHGLAEDRETFAAGGRDDEERPLTPRGRRRMRRGARGLRKLVPRIDLLATSPLVRAAQTARILGDAYRVEPVDLDALQPGMLPDRVSAWLKTHPEAGTVAVVGHEPGVSELVTWLMAGMTTPLLRMKKGGACLLELDEGIGAGRSRLLWSLPPQVLRELG